MKILINFGLCMLLPKCERLGHIYLLLHLANSLKAGTISFHFILFGNKPKIQELQNCKV